MYRRGRWIFEIDHLSPLTGTQFATFISAHDPKVRSREKTGGVVSGGLLARFCQRRNERLVEDRRPAFSAILSSGEKKEVRAVIDLEVANVPVANENSLKDTRIDGLKQDRTGCAIASERSHGYRFECCAYVNNLSG